MPGYNLILNVPGFSIVKVSGYHPLILDVVYQRKARCSYCKSKAVRKKSGKIREVHHELIGHRRTLLRFKAYKLYCEAFLAQNPAIDAIYHFQQQLHQLLMNKSLNQNKCREVIPIFLDMLSDLKQSPFKALAALGKTLMTWKGEVARIMWRFTKSNGITEGFHRKMKLIQRRAYGFRNFENYRVRVKVLCGLLKQPP